VEEKKWERAWRGCREERQKGKKEPLFATYHLLFAVQRDYSSEAPCYCPLFCQSLKHSA
jgi:hypothetical protein